MADSESNVVACQDCGAKNRLPASVKGRPRCAKCQGDLAWIVDADDRTFADAVDTARLVLVDLWAPWCGPCRMVAPVLAELASAHAGNLKVVKVNVDESPQTAQRYQARSIPMLLVMKGGNVVETIVGAQPRHVLEPKIAAHL